MFIYQRILVVICLTACWCFGKTSVKVKVEKALIFESKDSEYYLDSLGKGDEAYLLQEGAKRAKIKTRSGTVGWVPNSEVEYTKKSLGDTYVLENQEVRGWLDNPQALYILDIGNSGAEGMLLVRSFEHEFFEFIDRESLEKSNGEN